MSEFPVQRLRVLAERLAITHRPGDDHSLADSSWLAVVRAPEGQTVVHPVSVGQSGETWLALYPEAGHDLDAPGMLAGVVAPLGRAGIPVFVASTWHADLVLVPQRRLPQAVAVLRAAGHKVADDDSPG